MDTSWLKIAVFLVIAVAVVIGVKKVIRSMENKPKEPTTTIYDMAEKDRARLLAAPNAADFTSSNKNAQQAESAGKGTKTAAVQEQPAKPSVLYFSEVSEIDKMEADDILANVPSWRTMGRLPFTGYTLMVESCRQLMEKFPGTIYDYKARRALGQVPQRYWARYKITAKEVDLKYFEQQRPNTKPYTITEEE
jgi:Na+-transporting methylmalonyl-CoA/oxaloacetate decarboxylase gamma subunit